MKGCYILVIDLAEDRKISIGKLGNIDFKKGTYFYVGSALNNLEKRIQRHKSNEKRLHWHIDYLLKFGKIIDVYYKENSIREECIIADRFNERFESVIGFGCSDCRCNSHLFFNSDKEIDDIFHNLVFKKII